MIVCPFKLTILFFDKGHISIYLVTEVPDIVPIPHIQLETFIAHLADITDRPIQTTYLIRQSNLTQDVGSTFIKELEEKSKFPFNKLASIPTFVMVVVSHVMFGSL